MIRISWKSNNPWIGLPSTQSHLILDLGYTIIAKWQKMSLFCQLHVVGIKVSGNWVIMTIWRSTVSHLGVQHWKIYPLRPAAQVVKGWGGFVGRSRFNSQWGQKFAYQKKKTLKDVAWSIGKRLEWMDMIFNSMCMCLLNGSHPDI